MANYQDTIDRMMRQYPVMYPTEDHCLNQLFLTGGNGYWWQDGELITYEMTDEEVFTARAEREARLADSMTRLNAALDGLSDQEQADDIRRLIASFGRPVPLRLYYLSKTGSNLFDVPDDVKPDWLAAAHRAVDMVLKYAHTHGLMKWYNPEREIAMAKEARARLWERFGKGGL